MSDVITIKARTKAGHTQDFQVLEILEIDGKPYESPQETENLRSHMIHLDGRVSAIEKILQKGN